MRIRLARILVVASTLGYIAAGNAADHAQHGEKLGQAHFPTSCGEHVQQRFDHAVTLMHSFAFSVSDKVFSEILAAHPDCAMAYWGLAFGARANPLVGAPAAAAMKSGSAHIEKATAAGAKTQRERDFIAALDLYYKDWEKVSHRDRTLAYEKAMEQIYQRYPDDPEAAVFYALALNEAIVVLPADKNYTRHLKAARITEQVLEKHREHPGALHYLVHSYDFPALADKGLQAADRYGSAAPASAHALHMPSHIYSMLGMWEESIKSNLLAVGSAKGYVHAIDFMVYAHLQMGQDREALRLLQDTRALQKAGGTIAQRSPTGGVLPVHTAYAAIPARYAIERGTWKEATQLELNTTSPVADAITHFTRAMGFVRLRDAAGARTEIERLAAMRDELSKLNDSYWSDQVENQRLAAAAWIALLENKGAEAVTLMRSAADREDGSEKHVAMENRLWPMRELLGEILLELKQPAAALKEFETSLHEARNRLRGYYGAARAAETAGNRSKAAEYYGKVVALTKSAESNRPEVVQAKAFLASR
jgi:tetratricopeptide (TPR) repeat protein